MEEERQSHCTHEHLNTPHLQPQTCTSESSFIVKQPKDPSTTSTSTSTSTSTHSPPIPLNTQFDPDSTYHPSQQILSSEEETDQSSHACPSFPSLSPTSVTASRQSLKLQHSAKTNIYQVVCAWSIPKGLSKSYTSLWAKLEFCTLTACQTLL
ncbi:hypothetical protein PCANC_25530 [Puccinia coronata f. sp. avenae]|uniref:Uncharacterized protein n=1 Tax=Puccinia coronata f. sp. avenae TaxID=200324 RepID=A0A2N5S0Y8_9BASI|nr:hypothetical protein PCANC_25530 [Puccinia coronata f. sp. avenae]